MMWVWIAIAVVVVAGGALGPVLAGRTRRTTGSGAAVAARERYELLGHYVEVPESTTDPEAQAQLRQARERWNSAGAILATATADPDFALAERVAREGLAHVGTAHARLGLPGPD
jgi:hypothetical protein